MGSMSSSQTADFAVIDGLSAPPTQTLTPSTRPSNIPSHPSLSTATFLSSTSPSTNFPTTIPTSSPVFGQVIVYDFPQLTENQSSMEIFYYYTTNYQGAIKIKLSFKHSPYTKFEMVASANVNPSKNTGNISTILSLSEPLQVSLVYKLLVYITPIGSPAWQDKIAWTSVQDITITNHTVNPPIN